MGSASLLSVCQHILTALPSEQATHKQVGKLIQASWWGYDTTMQRFCVL